MPIDTSGLRHFSSVLNEYKPNITPGKKNPKIRRILEIAKEELNKAYNGKIKVDIYIVENKFGYTIYVKDKNQANPIIAFDEFGTGFYAQGSYPGQLPTQRITFNSCGQRRSTQGWVYYYGDPDDKSQQRSPAKVKHGGIKGWMANNTFHIGHPANATMYKACKKIIARIRSEL